MPRYEFLQLACQEPPPVRKSLIIIAALISACTVSEDNGAMNEDMNAPSDSNGGTDVPTQPDGNQPAPAPGTPSPQQPPAPEPATSVTFSAAPSRVAAGATMNLTLSNGSRQQVGYNLCTSAIETSAGRSVPTDRICTLELRTLNPGQRATYSYELPDRLSAGNYRFSTGIEWMDAGTRTVVRSNGFEVTGG